MLATQMEPIAARAVFRASTSPRFARRFRDQRRGAVGVRSRLTNMPVSMRDVQGSDALARLRPTPPMPSYLVAVAVGQFDALEDVVDAVPLRILTAKGKVEEAR